MSRTVDDVRKQLAATHLDYPHSRAVHDVELLLAEIDRLRKGIQDTLDNGLDHWATVNYFQATKEAGDMWRDVQDAATGLGDLLEGK